MRPEIKRARTQKSRSPDLPGPSSRVDKCLSNYTARASTYCFLFEGDHCHYVCFIIYTFFSAYWFHGFIKQSVTGQT